MLTPRKRLCGTLVLALFVAPTLSGCSAGGEPALITSVAKSGVVDGVIAPLKEAEDERDVQWLRENAPHSREENEAAREREEAAQMQAGEEQAGPAEGGEEG